MGGLILSRLNNLFKEYRWVMVSGKIEPISVMSSYEWFRYEMKPVSIVWKPSFKTILNTFVIPWLIRYTRIKYRTKLPQPFTNRLTSKYNCVKSFRPLAVTKTGYARHFVTELSINLMTTLNITVHVCLSYIDYLMRRTFSRLTSSGSNTHTQTSKQYTICFIA